MIEKETIFVHSKTFFSDLVFMDPKCLCNPYRFKPSLDRHKYNNLFFDVYILGSRRFRWSKERIFSTCSF